MKKFERLVWKIIGEEVHLALGGDPLNIGDHLEILSEGKVVPLVLIDKKVDSCAISFSAVPIDTDQDIAYLLKEGQLSRRIENLS